MEEVQVWLKGIVLFHQQVAERVSHRVVLVFELEGSTVLDSRLLDLYYIVGGESDLAIEAHKYKQAKTLRTTTILSWASSTGTAEPKAGAPAFLSRKVSLLMA